MRVQILSPLAEKLAPAVSRAGDTPFMGEIDATADFIVSFGYRSIIRQPMLGQIAGRAINIHISLLPWNRGADPNFWSWYDHTPKGVSIHYIDDGLDTGAIIVQRETDFSPDETLRTSYVKLQAEAARLFSENWPLLRTLPRGAQQTGLGSSHKLADKAALFANLPFGWDTPVAFIEEMGIEAAASRQAFHDIEQEIFTGRR